MLPMNRRTYKWLTTSLLTLCLLFVLSPFVIAHMDWIEHADTSIKLAVFPGFFILGGLIFLINGCIEYYADILPLKYRKRQSTRPKWETIYGTEQVYVVESVLKRFARSHGFRITDAFQFEPEDRIEDLISDFYPGRSDTDALLRRCDLTSSTTSTSTQLFLREYVDTRVGHDHGRASGPTNATGAMSDSGSGNIDRQARNRLSNTIRRYTEEKLTAFAFDEEINEIRSATADDTVQFVVDSLWLHYDDCKDHLAGLSKPEWDYFQRLILLLESDAEIERVRQRYWSVRQLVAGMALIGFGLCVFRFGIGWHLFGFALFFGPVSMLLSYWRNRSERRQAEEQLRLAPFSSISELRVVRQSVSGFSKRRYPAGAKIRRVHSRLMTMVVWLKTAVLWSFISPLILLFQTLPEKDTQTRIRHGAA
jgi:hypothetical protein